MLTFEEKKELFTIIGVLDALSNDACSIEEANAIYFSPRSANDLSNRNISNQITELVWECCELEDIQSIIPDKLKSNICMLKARAIELLKSE